VSLSAVSSANEFLDVERNARTAVDRHPADPARWHDLGAVLIRRWLLPEAEAALTRAVSLAPALAEAWSDLAFVQVTRGRLDAGFASARQASRLRTDLAAPYRHRAAALLARGQLDAAAVCAGDARRLDPDNPQALALLSSIWLHSGLVDGARRLIARTLERHPDAIDALLLRAEMSRASAPEAAHRDVAAVLTMNPWFAPAYFTRYLLERAAKQSDAALISLEAARAHHPDSEAYLLAHLDLLEERGDAHRAIAVAQESLPAHPHSRVLRMRLAMLCLSSGEKERALRHIPGVLPDTSAGNAWHVLANTWQALGRQAERRRCLEHAVAEPHDDAVTLAFADAFLRTGEPSAAFEQIASLDATPVVALLRGEALVALNRVEDAATSLDLWLARQPDDALTHMRLGIVRRQLQQFDEAEHHLRRATELAPQESVTFEQLAILLSERSRLDEALAAITQAVRIAPDRVSARFNLAVVLARLERWADAERLLRELAAVAPLNVNVRGNLGRVLANLQRHQDAADLFESLIELTPLDPGVRQGLLSSLSALRNFDEAIVAARAWTAEAPDDPHAWRSLALALAAVNSPEGDQAADRLAALTPESPLTCETRGIVALSLARPAEALEWFDRGLAFGPDLVSLMVNRALALEEVQGVAAAEAELRRALEKEPESHAATMNLAMVQLRLGRFDVGWHGYERRASALRGPNALLQARAAAGGQLDLSNASVLVRAEQGLGDTIQFMRYARRLARDAKEVWLQMQDQIAWMAWGMAPNMRVSGYRDPVPTTDFVVSLLSLPGYYSSDLGTIDNGDVPYLRADPRRVDDWRSRLGDTGVKVGLVWHTNPMHGNTRRWIPLRELASLGRLPGVRLISLQKSFGLDQLAHLPPGVHVETLGDRFDEGPDAFADAAAVIEHLDLVISIDTSMAHVAGALGRPVWTLLPKSSDWRWLLDRAYTPWYPTMRLFRQRVAEDWSGVAAALEGRLAAVVAGTAPAVWSVSSAAGSVSSTA
jgi:tetratricopeptide (TPR) repeat protein